MFLRNSIRLALLIAAVGSALWAFNEYGRGTNVVAPAKAIPAAPAIPVSAAIAVRRDVPITLDGLGAVAATNSVTIRAQVDGQLRQVLFGEGQEVKTGDVLARIDERAYRAQFDQASAKKGQNEALLANARQDLNRYSSLLKSEFAPRQQVDTTRALVAQLEAAIRADQAAIENAEVLLGYTTIRAPIDGRAGFRQIDPGNIVHVNDATPMVVITQMRPIAVVFTLPQDALPEVVGAMAGGARLEVTAISRDGRRTLDQGRLELIDNQIDPTTGTIRLKAIMPNEAGLLWPGQFVNARLRLGTRSQALTVPGSAVLRGQKGAYVYVVRADTSVEARPVSVAVPSDDSRAIVESGLEEGETVVATGQMRLRDGAKVEVRAP